jgi:hypothetical protein
MNSPPVSDSDLLRWVIQDRRRARKSPTASLATRIVAESAANPALVATNVKTGSNPPPRIRLTRRKPALVSSPANSPGTCTRTSSTTGERYPEDVVSRERGRDRGDRGTLDRELRAAHPAEQQTAVLS